MRKKTIISAIALIILVAFTSCDVITNFKTVETVSKGSIDSSVVGERTTISITFEKSKSGTSQIDGKKVTIIDYGRYQTLEDVFNGYGLSDGKRYVCSVTGKDVKYITRKDGKYALSNDKGVLFNISKDSEHTPIDEACTVTISFGGETIINYSNLPVSPDGLASGTLWNDNGTIRIV